MNKNSEKNNALIKKKNLIKTLNSAGIKRINPKVLDFLEEKFKTDISEFILILKQELDISGKKTLEVKNIQSAIKQIQKQEDFDY